MEHFLPFFLSNWYLFLGLVVVILLIVHYETSATIGGTQCISPQAVVTQLNRDKAVVIDIRDNKTYEGGHIINALHVLPSELDQKAKKLKKHQKKILIIACAQGQNAPDFAKKLRKHGFENIQGIKGGMQAWQEAGLPLTKGKAKKI